jgi:uncharacterized protein GlcG (DUF336 family)
MKAMVAGSAEYFNGHGGGTLAGFVSALYQDALGRAASAAEVAAWTSVLVAGFPRGQAALALFTSPEGRQQLVQSFYVTYLHRPADPGGLSGWTGQLLQGIHDDQVLASILSTDEFALGASDTIFLAQEEVQQLLDRASAASAHDDGVIAVVDRGGRLLGVRVESGVSPLITSNPGALVFAIDGALAEARTAAFFSNDQQPLTSRTVQFISQSTITQREVDSNPDIMDPNSPYYGPGYVAPVGLGGHFPPNVPNTPPVDLFGIEHTNRDSIIHPGADGLKTPTDSIKLPARFNVNPAYLPATGPDVQNLVPPESYGYLSGLDPYAQARGVGTLPGGIPLYKQGVLVGGIGVFFPGTTGYASAENSALSATYNPALPDRSLEAEFVAFAATGGSTGLGVRVGALGGVPPLPGFDIPATPPIYLAGITLDTVGPGGVQGPYNLQAYGNALPPGQVNGVDYPVDTKGDAVLDGQRVLDGWLVAPHAGAGITAADVVQIITEGVIEAGQVRAQIRPPGNTTRMVFAVTDSTGEVLGLYRMADATIFSIDVAVAKARNVAYYDNAQLVQPGDVLPGLPPGVAFTNRTFRTAAQPRYPEGIDGKPPGPMSILNDPGINPTNGLDAGPPLPASVYATQFPAAYAHDSFVPESNFHDPNNVANQNGVVWFPGSSVVYKPLGGVPYPVGGAGVSGDGVDQDDVVTAFAVNGYTPPANLTADNFFFGGARLPYMVFPRNPTQP